MIIICVRPLNIKSTRRMHIPMLKLYDLFYFIANFFITPKVGQKKTPPGIVVISGETNTPKFLYSISPAGMFTNINTTKPFSTNMFK